MKRFFFKSPILGFCPRSSSSLVMAQPIPDEVLNALNGNHIDNDKINPPCITSISTTEKARNWEFNIYASKAFSEGKTYLGNIYIDSIQNNADILNIKKIILMCGSNFLVDCTGMQLYIERQIKKIPIDTPLQIFSGIFSNEQPFWLSPTMRNITIRIEFHEPRMIPMMKLDTVPPPPTGFLTRGQYYNSSPQKIMTYRPSSFEFSNLKATMIFIQSHTMITKIILEIDKHHKYIFEGEKVKFKLPDGKFVYIISIDPEKGFYQEKKFLNFANIRYSRIYTEPLIPIEYWGYGYADMIFTSDDIFIK